MRNSRRIYSGCRGTGAWIITLSNCPNNWLPVELSRFLLSHSKFSLSLSLSHLKGQATWARTGQLNNRFDLLRWMALSRGISVGLLGGEELVLWRLLRLSMDGDAWTVILCWKSAKCIGIHKQRNGYSENQWRAVREVKRMRRLNGENSFFVRIVWFQCFVGQNCWINAIQVWTQCTVPIAVLLYITNACLISQYLSSCWCSTVCIIYLIKNWKEI